MPLYVGGFTNVDAYDAQTYIDYLDAGAMGRGPGKVASYTSQGIAAGMCVLDLGCGTGDDVRAVSELVGPTGRAIGVDFSRAMVAEAIRRGIPSNAVVLAASAYSLPFPDAAFDACRAERVFQHLERPDAAAAEIRRVLKPGGSVMIIDHDWETLVVSGGDANTTHRIVEAFANSVANSSAGRNHSTMLRRAGFREVQAVTGVSTLPFEPAYSLVLQSAVEYAKARLVITSEEADSWIGSLVDANRRGEFSYGVSAFAVLAWV